MFGNVAKTQGTLYYPVVKAQILKINDIAMFAAEFSNIFLEAECVDQVNELHMK